MPDSLEQDIDVKMTGALQGHAGTTCDHQGNAALTEWQVNLRIPHIETFMSSALCALQEVEGQW